MNLAAGDPAAVVRTAWVLVKYDVGTYSTTKGTNGTFPDIQYEIRGGETKMGVQPSIRFRKRHYRPTSGVIFTVLNVVTPQHYTTAKISK